MTGRRTTFGVTFPNRGALFGVTSAQEILRLSEVVDRSEDFASIWLGDSLFAKPRLESITLLSAIAARTRRVRLGPCCFASAPLRDPLVVAYQWATLDVISEGRTVFVPCLGTGIKGGGGGKFANEYKNMHVDPSARISRMEEMIPVLRKLWTEDDVTWQGPNFQFEGLSLAPKPVQKPCPPIWIASNVHEYTDDPRIFERAERRVARLADGWMTSVLTPEAFQTAWGRIQNYAREYGRDPAAMESCIHQQVNINEDRDAAREESIRFLEIYYDPLFARKSVDLWVSCGSVEQVAESLRGYVQAGVDVLTVRFTSWSQEAQLTRFMREVMPRVLR
jgi:alkanesulfonate monooxygenase SsuD/methylene tetrahydromethanopterin reductase-like flavin-dependent oxidoreductase (luciferase family)